MILLKFIVGSTVIYFGMLIYINAQHILTQALYLGNPTGFNTTKDDCIWKHGNDRDVCPDPDINIILYTSGEKRGKLWFDIEENDWLRNSGLNSSKENIILIHGYAGGDETLPIAVLRDAYLKHGGYNVFMVDWGKIGQPPCYVAAVHNIKTVSLCVAKSFVLLRNSGLNVLKTTCVGHSLGAHICGLLSNHLNFRLERIIALDSARPLIKPGNQNRLDIGDAKSVQVLHTNAGYYGEGGRVGHVDFCINGGRRQPYCGNTTNVNLCSHIWSVCYLAQSIFEGHEVIAEPCNRKCPSGISLIPRRPKSRIRHNNGRYGINYGIPMGQRTPTSATGSFCIKDTKPPFCSTSDESSIGDTRCCLPSPEWNDLI